MQKFCFVKFIIIKFPAFILLFPNVNRGSMVMIVW